MKYAPAILFAVLAAVCVGYTLMPTGEYQIGANALAIICVLVAGVLLMRALFR